MNPQIEKRIRQSIADLSACQIETSSYEIKFLLAEVLNCEVGDVLSYSNEMTKQQLKQFEKFISMRHQHIPADKIIGHKGFYKHEFSVNYDVLSPRSDTEILVEATIEKVRANNCKTILELGVGSGCVILSIRSDCKQLFGTGIDISTAALAVTQKNASAMGLSKRLSLRQADWFASNFVDQLETKFDIIVSNPPYICSDEIKSLATEVREYDPIIALDGGKDGLDSYRRIAELVPYLLNEGGYICLEVGENQAHDVSDLFMSVGLKPEKIIKDFSDIERCVIIKK